MKDLGELRRGNLVVACLATRISRAGGTGPPGCRRRPWHRMRPSRAAACSPRPESRLSFCTWRSVRRAYGWTCRPTWSRWGTARRQSACPFRSLVIAPHLRTGACVHFARTAIQRLEAPLSVPRRRRRRADSYGGRSLQRRADGLPTSDGLSGCPIRARAADWNRTGSRRPSNGLRKRLPPAPVRGARARRSETPCAHPANPLDARAGVGRFGDPRRAA